MLPITFPLTPAYLFKHIILLVITGSFVFAASGVIAANSNTQKSTSSDIQTQQVKLNELQLEIKQLREELTVAIAHKQDIQQQLRLLDLQIGKSTSLIRELETQITLSKQKLSDLELQRRSLDQRISSQRNTLSKQIRQSYIMGQQDFLKMLLNLQEPTTLTRTLTYYDYAHKARSVNINSMTKNIQAINDIAQATDKQTTVLESTQKVQLEEQQALKLSYQSRLNVLERLNNQIKNTNNRRQMIETNIDNLKKLLNELSQQKLPPKTPPSKPELFSALKGNMNWPVQGKLKVRYGSSRHLGNLKWQGIVIDSKPGSEIHAVSTGRVVFADWLRGFGLLIIIDHGDGFMSLYGQNQSLLKRSGEWVSRDEAIATLGNSGGGSHNGLYFEIRYNGKPVNPLKWLERRK